MILQAQPAAKTPIQHVVVLFQENVSFDHYFATYPNAANTTTGEPVFTAAPGTPSVNGLSGPLLTNNPNSAQPFRLSRAQEIVCDQNHNYGPEQAAVNSGLMNKFPETVGVGTGSGCTYPGFTNSLTMGYYDGNTVTAMWNYAQNYAMSDNFFGTTFGPSAPGVINLISGNTSGATVTSGSPAGIIGGGATSGALIGDARPSVALDDCTLPTKVLATMSGKNIGDLLNAAKLTWGWFEGGFKPSSVANGVATCATAHNNVSGASAGTDYIPHHAGFMFYPQTANPHHLPPTSAAAIGTTDQANHNYDVSDWLNALAAGNLSAVSYLKAGAYQDGHASYSDPLDEQTFVVNTINAIMASPFWSSTAIFITYDDSDGFYDHVVGPIVDQSAVSDDAFTGPGNCGSGSNPVTQGRCGYGPRLPLLVVSPYAKVNYVDHEVTDQSSVLRFVEDNWGLGRLPTGSTDAIAGSLMGLFNFNNVAPAVYLDPSMGVVTKAPSGGGTTPPPAATTLAVANPKNATVSSPSFQLDGTQSTSVDGKPLTYLWTIAAGSPQAGITGGTTATPTVQFGNERATYTFQLTVTDDMGGTSTDFATINFIGN